MIFCSFGEAIRDHPELVRKYLGTVVPGNDNSFAALNAAVACLTVRLFMCLKACAAQWRISTYFRINAEKTSSWSVPILVASGEQLRQLHCRLFRSGA
ncbi:hypothetical protein ACLB1M_13985 [Escherichia coli]